MPAATLAALLRVARDLTIQDRLDVEAAQRLLGNLPRDDLDSQILGAVKHARKVVSAAADQDQRHILVARSALARVVTLLEQHTAISVNEQQDGGTPWL